MDSSFATDVGLHPESSHTHPWEQNRAGLTPQSGRTACVVGEKSPYTLNIQSCVRLMYTVLYILF